MVWTEGRRLKSITKDGQTTSYQYDANGRRIQKTNADGSYTKYCVLDGRVIGEIIYKKTANGVKWSHGMRYIYGDDGSVIGFGLWDANTQNEWERYYFIKNVQGDILHVYREADNKLVASYEYDPFGKVSVTYSDGDMANENPFRYRSYYYDTETGFYYLNSRYYDPTTCRFINADALLSTGQGFIGYNMFAYCLNNPANMTDSSGHWPNWVTNAIDKVVDKVKSAAVNVVVSAVSLVVKLNNAIRSLPLTGDPNSSAVLPNPDGTPKQKRWYGPDGNAVRDRDYNHPGDMPFPHDHEWKNGERGKEHLPPSPDYEFSWEPVVGIGIVTTCFIGIAIIAADDATGIGVVDDYLLGPLGVALESGFFMIFR